MNPEIENQIRNKVCWAKLPSNVKGLIGNSQKEYERAISSYCIKNQLRFKNSLAKTFRKDEKKYYEELLEYSRENYMLYPYHLSDLFVKGLRITPFNYYLKMMSDLMSAERSYDTLPNFTAFDCIRLLGIGRNQYIDIMNKYRSSNRTVRLGFSRRKPVTSLLPIQPIDTFVIEPWWLINVGCISEDDVKILSEDERIMLDRLIDTANSIEAGKLNYGIVHSLYRKGLIYIDVPMNEMDKVEVPPLEGFIMNRVVGDYFETLLYKLFVSIDDRTCLGELASLLEVDLDLVLNAVSLYCRLSFAKKKTIAKIEDKLMDSSWNDYLKNKHQIQKCKRGMSLLDSEFSEEIKKSEITRGISEQPDSDSMTLLDLQDSLVLNQESLSTPTSNNKRIGFLFDSTLTAFLMMGNLSSGLKNHAVTMFEVGKLTDQALDSFIAELDKVPNEQSEGEAQRYFDHAIILKKTIQFLRHNKKLNVFSGMKPQKSDETSDLLDETVGVDLLRCESLAGLDDESKQRILAKNYSILISMAPISSPGDSNNSPPITCDAPFHFGPAIPEINSVWFKIYLYKLIGDGPASLLIPHGHKLHSLPEVFHYYEKFMINSWGHDSTLTSNTNILTTLNDLTLHAPVLIESYGIDEKKGSTLAHISFNDPKHVLFKHPSVTGLHDKLSLEYSIGYISLLNPYRSIDLNSEFEVDFSEWHFFDLRFGVPLFDQKLNTTILMNFLANNLGSYDNLVKMQLSNQKLILDLLAFIQNHQVINVFDKNFFEVPNHKDDYLISSLTNKTKKQFQPSILIKPTQCVLFDEMCVSIFEEDY